MISFDYARRLLQDHGLGFLRPRKSIFSRPMASVGSFLESNQRLSFPLGSRAGRADFDERPFRRFIRAGGVHAGMAWEALEVPMHAPRCGARRLRRRWRL